MQTTALSMRQAQGRVLGKREVKAKAKTWLSAKSKSMTTLFGFEVTRLEGLRFYGATALMVVGTALWEVCAPATFACIALAGYNVYKLNVEHPEEKGGEA